MRPAGLPVSLAFLDLDHFKLVNDAHGHLVGSELLARTGERLQELSRKQDWCFRYGGDEFVILMPETGARGRPGAGHGNCTSALMETEFQMKNGLDAARQRQRGRGHRARRRRHRARHHRRRRYADVRGKDQWAGSGKRERRSSPLRKQPLYSP